MILTDEQLITEYAASGAQDVFHELYRRFGSRLFSFLLHRLHDVEAARDRVQDTFLLIHLHARTFRAESSAATWIFKIAINRAITVGRLRMVRHEQQNQRDTFHLLPDYRLGPDEEVAAADERCRLERAIGEMTGKSAAVIRLTDIEGLDYETTARRLGIPTGTVRSRRHRAVNLLRKAMAALVLLAAGVALGADPPAPTAARLLTVHRVHDGDSVSASIDLGYGLSWTPKGGIRAHGYDAWEVGRQREQVIGRISDAEIEKGKAARDDLLELLKTHDLYAEDSGQIDPHGRNSSILWARPRDGKRWLLLATWMEERGHLRVARAK